MTAAITALALPNRHPWMDDALCRQVDCGDIWFVDKGESTKPAKRVCALCPVAAECLQYALDNDERFGVFGGLSERERRRLKRGIPIKHAVLKAVEMVPCGHCGKDFRKESKTSRYCSKTCYKAAHYNRTLQLRREAVRKCFTCGDAFTGTVSGKYCSPDCRRAAVVPKLSRLSERTSRFARTCRTCGTEFDAVHHLSRYCTPECKHAARCAQQRKKYQDKKYQDNTAAIISKGGAS